MCPRRWLNPSVKFHFSILLPLLPQLILFACSARGVFKNIHLTRSVLIDQPNGLSGLLLTTSRKVANISSSRTLRLSQNQPRVSFSRPRSSVANVNSFEITSIVLTQTHKEPHRSQDSKRVCLLPLPLRLAG